MKRHGIMDNIKQKIYPYYVRIKVRNDTKIFCIGRNKTGTTTLKTAVQDLRLVVGNQYEGERLFRNYLDRDFNSIIEYCRKGVFFQDVPFNLPYLYPVLDNAFPGSKFILTVRNSAEEWYESFISFQIKLHGFEGRLPTKDELVSNRKIFPGYAYLTKKDVYRTPDHDLYNKEVLMKHYDTYNDEVKHYFANKGNLLVLNVSEPGSYQQFCKFIGVEPLYDRFPWTNKTSKL
jgi:hypothetical protein